ncbi:MAG: hypothetical protein HY985_16975 [Magnetospirillum sp.]|nr:hypothetical protein [Magnetospirillum sp.]
MPEPRFQIAGWQPPPPRRLPRPGNDNRAPLKLRLKRAAVLGSLATVMAMLAMALS